MFWKRPSGAAAEERWFGLEQANPIGTDWSFGGRYIDVTNASAGAGFTILVWETSGKGKPTLAVQRPLNAMHGRLSPDGRWLAYASDESGQWHVYVQPFPVTNADDRKQLSFDGGVGPGGGVTDGSCSLLEPTCA
jgi:Tol biopolymer transport system component